MKYIYITPLPALLVALVVALPAYAGQADRESALRWYDAVDTDKSQTVDAAEMSRVRDRWFPRYDGDGDGYVTLDEFNFSVPVEMEDERERRSRRFSVMDLDGDGRLSRDEHLAFGDRVMQAADLNGDGVVTRQEFADTVAPQ